MKTINPLPIYVTHTGATQEKINSSNTGWFIKITLQQRVVLKYFLFNLFNPTGFRHLQLNRSFFLGNFSHVVFLKNFLGEIEIIHRAFAVGVIQNNRFTKTRSFSQTGVAMNDGIKNQIFKMAAHFGYDLVTQTQAAIVHRH